MKKIYFYGMLAAGLLASCSNDAPATSDVNNESELARVPITLGASSNGIVQRTIDEQGLFLTNLEGETIGVFAVAKDMVAWNWEDNANDGTCILNDVKGTVDGDKNITWTPEATYYYPVMSEHNYSFFGYYPTNIVNEEGTSGFVKTVNRAADLISVTFTNLTGHQDLICGNAVAEEHNGINGYNAKYMRQEGALTPMITFEHQLIRLDINVKAAAGNGEDAAKFKVTKIELLNAPKSLSMVVAHRTDVNQIGSIYYERDTENIGTYELTGEKNLQYSEPEAGTSFGSLMLPAGMLVGEEENKYFEASITIETVDGSTEIYEGGSSYNKTFKILPPTSGTSTAFGIGKAYTINLTVSGPESITAQATLSDWTSAGTSDVTIE